MVGLSRVCGLGLHRGQSSVLMVCCFALVLKIEGLGFSFQGLGCGIWCRRFRVGG